LHRPSLSRRMLPTSVWRAAGAQAHEEMEFRFLPA
jgi:hypothetical protein